MELQFNKTVCPCLQKVVSKPQSQELTQELRLPDTMPDIGRILGCWGQILIRGKEWRTGGMTVSGGVMVWVLYAPEDGSQPQSLDAWIPFQMKWEFPETQRDGFIRICPYLKAMDCRSLSARKMMIRSGVSMMGEALEPVDVDIWHPDSVPEDVQLLKQTYPMDLPQEAGEKSFLLEEELVLPGNLPQMQKLVRCEIQPRISEHKVMAGKLVFRGACGMHLLYASDDGEFHTWDFEMPFSQFADLDRDYGPNASAEIDAVVTGFEQDRDAEGKVLLKCGVSAQYVVCDRCMIDVVEDAYSNIRSVKQHQELLRLPVRLDIRRDEISVNQNINTEGQKIVDIAAFWDCPVLRQSGSTAEAEMNGQFQTLLMSESGTMQNASSQKKENWSMDSDPENQIFMKLVPGNPKSGFGPEGAQISMTLSMETAVFSQQGIPMITSLELGEVAEPDPMRPSLIVRRCNDCTLWELAKTCGSTVEAICAANQLQQEPLGDRMLLIPVI